MRLSARPIITYGNINLFSYSSQWIVRAGDPLTLYFQLVDLDQSVPINLNTIFTGNSNPGNLYGLRYLAGIGSPNQPYSISVTFPSINQLLVINVAATQVDANDSSIWSVSIPSSSIPNSGNVQFAVTEGANVRTFAVINMIAVESPLTNGSC